MLLPINFDEISAGDVVCLDDISQLPQFEDIVVDQIDPDVTQSMRDAWAGRVAIKDVIRPMKFNGTISDIRLQMQSEPLEKLITARERGWKFSNKGGILTNLSGIAVVQNSYIGFDLSANAKSSGRGTIGQIQAELWYRRVSVAQSIYKNKSYEAKLVNNNGGSAIVRLVTVPRIERQAFIELDESSRRIGFEVLKRNMLNPIVQPITQ